MPGDHGKNNLLADGDMEESGTSAWVAVSGAILTKSTASPHSGTQALRIEKNGAGGWAAQAGIMVVGASYRVTGWCRSVDGVSQPRVCRATAAYIWLGTTATTWQEIDTVYTAADVTDFLPGKTPSGLSVEFDDMKLVRIG